jgi:hypothetical protein
VASPYREECNVAAAPWRGLSHGDDLLVWCGPLSSESPSACGFGWRLRRLLQEWLFGVSFEQVLVRFLPSFLLPCRVEFGRVDVPIQPASEFVWCPVLTSQSNQDI